MTDKNWDRYKSMRGRWIPLSVRETYLSDYGITHEQGKKIIDYCRKATGYEQVLLLQSCQNVKQEIANFLFINLTTGLGYDNICKREFQDVKDNLRCLPLFDNSVLNITRPCKFFS